MGFYDVSSTISLFLAVGSVYIGKQSSKTGPVCVVRSSGAACNDWLSCDLYI
jgi:hypothetical protein